MPDDDVCGRGYHLAPMSGGSCPCGMVTRVPAAPSLREPSGVRDLVARCLVERGGVPDLPDLRRRAQRVLDALAEAGLVVAPRGVSEPPVGLRSA
jgi:hypothetical protein